MDPELVLDRMTAHVVLRAQRAVGIDQIFRNEEQRDAAGAGRRIGKARQHEMHDVVGEIVLAVGDEDFLAGDAIAAVRPAFGLGAQRREIRARLRLGELHRPHPLARHELGQIGLLERFGAVGGKRFGGSHGQQRAEPERHCGGMPHLQASGVDQVRQALPAPIGRRGEPVPAGRAPGRVGLLPAGRHLHRAVLERRAVDVADAVERRDHVGREFARLFEHRVDEVLGQIAVETLVEGALEPRRMLKREGDVADRRLVGHGHVPERGIVPDLAVRRGGVSGRGRFRRRGEVGLHVAILLL